MDPALRELLEGNAEDEVEAILRLDPDEEPPRHVRIVARFGDIATVRLPRGRIAETWNDEGVVSLKAPRPFGLDPDPLPTESEDEEGAGEGSGGGESVDEGPENQDQRRPPDLPETGRGVIVAVVDWGFDFAHPNFRNPDGSTRALALWDQSAPGPGPEPYGYGRVYGRAEIDRALRTDDPYRALGYHPAAGDPAGRGAHGTHVLDIAAGNGRAEDAPAGIAPEADLLFVHLATRGTGGRANLGDSVTLLEALDWITHQAGDRPWVANLSVGQHGGPHTGNTLVERGLDALLAAAPGRAVVQSTGNYYQADVHAAGTLRPGQEHTLRWWTDRADVTPNELEVWYPGGDVFGVALQPPDGEPVRVPLGGQAALIAGGREVGRAYHRAQDPADGDHHVDVFLDPAAPPGCWRLTLSGEDVVDGRWHAWVERDVGCPTCQSRFDPADADPQTTTGTIANGRRGLAVGAYDAHSRERRLAPFSSCGPTRDGRLKPDLLAPGARVLAARSASLELGSDTPLLTRQSGTSMAAPHVTGTVALLFEAAGRPLAIQETRRLLLSTAESAGLDEAAARLGSGYLDVAPAVEAARAAGLAEAAAQAREDEGAEAPDETHWTAGETDLTASDGPLPAPGAGQETEDAMDHRTGSGRATGCGCRHRISNEDGPAWPAGPECACRQAAAAGAPEPAGREWWNRGDEAEWWNAGEEPAEALDPGLLAPLPLRREIAFPNVAAPRELDEAAAVEAFRPSAGGEAEEVPEAAPETASPWARLADLEAAPWLDGAPVSAARLFDAVLAGGALRRRVEAELEIVALPGEACGELAAGDLLVRRALGEGGLGNLALVTGEMAGEAFDLPEDLAAEGWRPGTYVPVIESRRGAGARLALDGAGRLPLDQLVLRPRVPPRSRPLARPRPWTEQAEGPAFLEVHTCKAGEGPPAVLPDPEGKGPHPLVYKGVTKKRSRNPTVGDAQEQLNRFLDATKTSFAACPRQDAATLDFLDKSRKKLQDAGQFPLAVDCRFGDNSEIAAKMFQACLGLDRDGKIGPQTWGRLTLLRGFPAAPQFRPCCILAPTLFATNDNLVDPTALGTHRGASEANGLIYTGQAGFFDLGHVRELCDITKLVHDQILAAGLAPSIVRTMNGVAVFKKAPADAMATAKAIAFDDGLGHEIVSWKATGPGAHNSAFSPEDLCSNFLGTLLAERAIAAGGAFAAAVTSELDKMVTSFVPQTVAESRKAFDLVNGRWVDFSGVTSLLSDAYLKRRNFTKTPFQTGHPSDVTPPALFSTTLPDLSSEYEYVHLEAGNVIPRSKYPAEIAAIRKQAKIDHGPDFDKP